jgi:hypothetical protein
MDFSFFPPYILLHTREINLSFVFHYEVAPMNPMKFTIDFLEFYKISNILTLIFYIFSDLPKFQKEKQELFSFFGFFT